MREGGGGGGREQQREEGGGRGFSGEAAERKRMREEIAVWAEIRLLHFLGRKWIRSGERCSLLLTLKNATELHFFFFFSPNPFSHNVSPNTPKTV